MEIIKKPYVSVTGDLVTRTVTLRWTDYTPSAEYREALMVARDAVKKYSLILWLADLRNMTAILQADEKWTVEEWFPSLAKAGLERMAILTSSDFFNQMSVNRIMDGSAPVIGFQVAYFDDESKANAWLVEAALMAEPVL